MPAPSPPPRRNDWLFRAIVFLAALLLLLGGGDLDGMLPARLLGGLLLTGLALHALGLTPWHDGQLDGEPFGIRIGKSQADSIPLHLVGNSIYGTGPEICGIEPISDEAIEFTLWYRVLFFPVVPLSSWTGVFLGFTSRKDMVFPRAVFQHLKPVQRSAHRNWRTVRAALKQALQAVLPALVSSLLLPFLGPPGSLMLVCSFIHLVVRVFRSEDARIQKLASYAASLNPPPKPPESET